MKKEICFFGKAFLSKKRFVLKEKQQKRLQNFYEKISYVSLDKDIVKAIDREVKTANYLKVTRSEVLEVILKAVLGHFPDQKKISENIRKLTRDEKLEDSKIYQKSFLVMKTLDQYDVFTTTRKHYRVAQGAGKIGSVLNFTTYPP